MTTAPPLVTKRTLGLAGLAAFAACTACCAVPLLAAAGIGGGVLSAVAGLLRPGADLLVASVVGVGVLGVLAVRGRKRAQTGCDSVCKTDAGCGCAPTPKGSLYTTPAPAPDEPIVCTADLGDNPTMQQQLDGYRAAFEHLERVERFTGGVRWVFSKRPELELELRQLAESEHQCCKFFHFDLRSTGDAIVWETTAGEAAASVLEEFGNLPERLHQHRRGSDLTAVRESVGRAGLVFAADRLPSTS